MHGAVVLLTHLKTTYHRLLHTVCTYVHVQVHSSPPNPSQVAVRLVVSPPTN